jgi:hypothetical protein
MFPILNALNAYSGSVQAISTVILVIVTICYVGLTWRLANAATEQIQARARAMAARRRELTAHTKFLLEALRSLPFSSDANTFSGERSIGTQKMVSFVRWDDFDFNRFVMLAAEVSSRAGESAAIVRIKMPPLSRRLTSGAGIPARGEIYWGSPWPHQEWDDDIHAAWAAVDQVRSDAGASS